MLIFFFATAPTFTSGLQPKSRLNLAWVEESEEKSFKPSHSVVVIHPVLSEGQEILIMVAYSYLIEGWYRYNAMRNHCEPSPSSPFRRYGVFFFYVKLPFFFFSHYLFSHFLAL